jgi:UDP-GlcNAc:undecaprenyl-phosphate GlcNAc-1-phosphate transferase
MPLYLVSILIFLSSLLVSKNFYKALIKISLDKKIFDKPNVERKLHKIPIPNIGGIGFVFTILFILSIFWQQNWAIKSINFFLASTIFLFLLGLQDDLIGLSARKRFFGQIISGLILIVLQDCRIQNLSLFGFYDIDYYLSIFISLLFFILITNAYNLIDGLNGLLGSLTILSSVFFSIIFNFWSDYFLLSVAICTIAVSLGFLYYNLGNASIFMGSSGSYVIGCMMFYFSVSVINQPNQLFFSMPKFSLIFSILAIPLYDTLRIFCLRILNNKSPFAADANHIHHRLLKIDLSHSIAVIKIIAANIFLFLINLMLIKFPDIIILIIDFIILVCISFVLEIEIGKKK